MNDVLIKRGDLDIDMHTGEGHVKMKAAIGTFASQGTPRIVSKPPETRPEAYNRFSLTAFTRHQPCQNLDL